MIIKGVSLPDWLANYRNSNSKEKSVSEYSPLNPEGAIRGNGWKTSIDATGGIIFDIKSFAEPDNMEEVIPLVVKLKSFGFNVYLLCKNREEKYLYEVENDYRDLPKNIKNLESFDEKTDYVLAAQKNLSRDKTILVDFPKTRELKQSLDSVEESKGDFRASHLKGGFNISLPNDFGIQTQRKRNFTANEYVVNNLKALLEEGRLLFPAELIAENVKSAEGLDVMKEYLNLFKTKRLTRSSVGQIFKSLTDVDAQNIFREFLVDPNHRLCKYDLASSSYLDSIAQTSEAALLIKDLDFRRQFIEDYLIGDKIENIDEVAINNNSNLCFVLAALESFPEAQKKLAERIAERTKEIDQIDDSWCEGIVALTNSPDIQRNLAEKVAKKYLKEEPTKNFPKLLASIRGCPDIQVNILQKILHRTYGEFVMSIPQNITYELLENYPGFKDNLISRIKEVIINEIINDGIILNGFYATMMLFTVIKMNSNLPEIQEWFIDQLFRNCTEDEIKNQLTHSKLVLFPEDADLVSNDVKNRITSLFYGKDSNQESREKYLEEFLSDSERIEDLDSLIRALKLAADFPSLQRRTIKKCFLEILQDPNLDSRNEKIFTYIGRDVGNFTKIIDVVRDTSPKFSQDLVKLFFKEIDFYRNRDLVFEEMGKDLRLTEEFAMQGYTRMPSFFDYLLKNSISNNDMAFTTKPCSLHISRLTEQNFAELQNYHEHLSEVAIISVTQVENFGLVADLVDRFPKACHFVLPRNVLKDFKNRFPAISCESGDLDIELRPYKTMGSFEKDLQYRGLNQRPINNKSVFNTDSSLTSSVPAIKLAQVLNDELMIEIEPSIRTEVVKRNIVNGLDQESYVPNPNSMRDVNIENRILTAEKIEEFKSHSSSEALYYLMGSELKKDQMTRLNSASTQEEFMGYFSKNSAAKITIKKGDDDFLYATSDQDCSISFVTKVNQRELNDYTKIALAENRYIDKIRQYLDNPKYKRSADPNQDFPEYDSRRHQEWMKKLFDDRLGVCRHRVAAVEYALRQDNIGQGELRAVVINNNHEILEIKHENKWYSVDLGGGGTVNGSIDETKNFDLPTDDLEEVMLDLMDINPDLLPIKNELDSLLREKIEPEKVVRDRDVLLNESLNSDKKKILIVTNKNNEAHANFLMAEAREAQRKFFYIDKPSDIDLDWPSLLVNQNGQAAITEKGQFEKFLSSIKNEDSPLLLINWDNFTAQQKVALNSIIDRERSINGRSLPEALQLIGLSEKLSKDASFLSRHDVVLKSNLSKEILALSPTKSDSQEIPSEIDLEGFSDYRSKLFGRISIEKTALNWHKNQSDFVSQLEAGVKKFNISNTSAQNFEKLEYEFRQAQAKGYFDYHGYKIPVAGDVEISFSNERKFNFSAFKNYQITAGVTYDQLENPQEYHLINPQIFDKLLYGKKIEQELYEETQGLIEEHAGQNLNLFVTSSLSDSHWFCLLKKAEEFGVSLNIAAAKEVSLPKNLEANLATDLALTIRKSYRPQIIVTNDATRIESDQESTIIDIEDLAYQDFRKIDFKFENSLFHKFKLIESELLERMSDPSKPVIIRGEFDPDLLQMMHPMLLAHGQSNVTFIIEDKNISNRDSTYNALSFLSKDEVAIQYFRELAKSADEQKDFVEDNKKYDSLGEDSLQKSQDFLAERKEKLRQFLQNNSLLKLSGHSGVGKTSLVEEIAKEDDVELYHEMSSFADFAQDQSKKIKILVINEANIDDVDFTRFSQLKNGGNKEVFCDGKIHQLDANHKIIFTSNDRRYGGGRKEQKLFEDGSVPIMHLNDFPTSYIYEVLLKEALHPNADQSFKEKCAELIESYQAHNARQQDLTKNLTVRELQEQVLQFLSPATQKEPIKSQYFVSTEATSAAENLLRTTINIRKEQHHQRLPGNGLGTNGVLLKGDSGIGKSEMVREILKQESIHEITANTVMEPNQQYYYRIDSRLPLAQKKEIIVKAFEEGNMIWIDELNSCIDDGLEKILNSVLTGAHPDSGKPAANAGFMMIATANNIDMEGRSLISPAILHRLNYVEMTPLSNYSQQDLNKIIGHFVEKNNPDLANNDAAKENFTASFESLQKDYGQYLNFRVFEGVLNEYFSRTNLHPGPKISSSIADSLQNRYDQTKMGV